MSAASTATADGPAREVAAALGGIFRDITRGGPGRCRRRADRLRDRRQDRDAPAALIVPLSEGRPHRERQRDRRYHAGRNRGPPGVRTHHRLGRGDDLGRVAPWIPGRGVRRAVAAMPVAVALGGSGLIDGENRDFSILDHDPAVVGILVLLVALIGFMFPLVDDALDRGCRPRRGGTISARLQQASAPVLGPPVAVVPDRPGPRDDADRRGADRRRHRDAPDVGPSGQGRASVHSIAPRGPRGLVVAVALGFVGSRPTFNGRSGLPRSEGTWRSASTSLAAPKPPGPTPRT